MPELLNPCDSKEIPSQKPGRCTGPRTEAGKARSSLNRLTHGCRSEQTVIRGEDPEEFEFTVQAWFDHYQPGDDELAGLLVYETALAHWFLKRNRRRLEQIETNLPGNAWTWTDEHQKLYSNFSRYKTAAERTFRRCLKDVENYFDRQHRREQLDALAAARLAAIDRKWISKKQESPAHTVPVPNEENNSPEPPQPALPENEPIKNTENFLDT